MESGFHFEQVLDKFKEKKSKLPKIIANVIQTHFKESFVNQGFNESGSIDKWQEVQRREQNGGEGKFKYNYRIRGSKSGSGGYSKGKSTADRTNPILQGKGSGKLSKSIQVTKATWEVIEVATVGDVVNKYAAVHNFGERAGRGKGFQMPKRMFIGDSENMFKKIDAEIEKNIDAIFK